MTTHNVHFLIVDDDDVDVLSLKRILINLDSDIGFSVCHDGEEALKFIRKSNADEEEHKQLIVLLDINMPRMTGHEFLEVLRSDEVISDTIVFVLSTSTDPRDVQKSYGKFVSGYIPKDRLTEESFRALFENYIELVKIPDRLAN